MRYSDFAFFKRLTVVLLFSSVALTGCAPSEAGVASPAAATPTVQNQPTIALRPTAAPTNPVFAPTPTAAIAVTPGVTTSAATSVPAANWKTFTSTKHHYQLSYPVDWKLEVQTSGPGHDPEYVSLRLAEVALPMFQLYALKDAPPIVGFENCTKNLVFRGVQACSLSMPKGQQPARQMLIFQKNDSHYQLSMLYEEQQQLGMFDEIVRTFQFTP